MLKTFIVNPIQENCYILSDDTTSEAVIIDCGALFPAEGREIAAYIDDNGLHPVAHLLTHAHFDHLFGAQLVADRYGLLPRFAAADRPIYDNAAMQASALFGQQMQFPVPKPGPYVDAATTMACGRHTISVISTPGHTPGGVCYYCADLGILFSGDTLFRMSIGRTDLPGGDYGTLCRSLHTLADTLPDATRVLPGHGPVTIIADERRANPYLQ